MACATVWKSVYGAVPHFLEAVALTIGLIHFYQGPLDEDKDFNPDFYDWNHVFVVYCDGAFFAGHRDMPAEINSTKLYFRGHRILVASLKDLLKTKGLNKATDVIITGDSAGGMAAYYHADEIKSMLPESTRFKAAPFSGIFLDRPYAVGENFFAKQFKTILTCRTAQTI